MPESDWDTSENGAIDAALLLRGLVAGAPPFVALRLEFAHNESEPQDCLQLFLDPETARLVGRGLLEASDAVDRYRNRERH